MGIALGKVGKGTYTSGTTITANWTGGGNSTAGSTLLALYSDPTSTGGLPSTPAGWTLRSSVSDASGGVAVVYELVNASAISGLTITVNASNPDCAALDIVEFTGASSLDSSTAYHATSGSTTITTNAITTVAATTVMVALFSHRHATTTPWALSTPGAGFTQAQTNNQINGATTSTTNYVTFDVVSSVQTGVSTTAVSTGTTTQHSVLLAYTAASTSLTFPTASKFQLPLPEYAPIQGFDEPIHEAMPFPLRSIASGMVQKADARNANSALQQTIGFASNVTGNNLIIAAISTNCPSGPTTLTGVTDSQGDPLVQAGSYQSQGNVTVSLWYVQARSTGPLSVSYTPVTASASAISILEYNGFKTLDGTASANNSAANLWNLGPIPINNNSDLCIAAFANNNIGNVMTAKGGFVLESDPANNSVACGIYVMDCRSSAGMIAAGTNGTTDNYCAVGASFITFAPNVPSAWQPFAIRPTTYPIDETPIQGLTEPAQRRFIQTTGFSFTPWKFPTGRKAQEIIPEIEILPTRALFPTALKSAQSTIVQSNSTRFAQSASSRTLAYSSNITAGNLVVVCVTTFDPTLSIAANHVVTDTLNNNWQLASQATGNSNTGLVCSMWFCVTHFSGADTVTVNPNGNVFLSMAVLEYSGNTGLNDGVVASSSKTSPTSLLPFCGPCQVSAASDLVIAFFGANDTGNHFTPLEGFVSQANPVNAADNAALYVSDMSASAPIKSWMLNSISGTNWVGITASFFTGASLPTHPFQPMASKFMPVIEEIFVPWQRPVMPAKLLPGFSQTGTPWTFPFASKFQPPLPELDLTQPSGRPTIPWNLTGGVNPNPSTWQPFAIRFMPAPPDDVISQGLTEPAKKSIPAIYVGFTKKFTGTFIPWDHSHPPTVSRRHQQEVCNVLNTLMASLDIGQLQGNPQAPWRLIYNPNTGLSWAGTPPATIKEALDRIAAALKALGSPP